MCGRFTLTIGSTRLQAAFPGLLLPEDGPPLAPRYNIVPTQPVATILNGETPCLRHLRWGLIPFWVRDVETGARLINARAETIAEKPSFHTAFRRRRCLIPADGFYEWQRLSSGPDNLSMCVCSRTGCLLSRACGNAGLPLRAEKRTRCIAVRLSRQRRMNCLSPSITACRSSFPRAHTKHG